MSASEYRRWEIFEGIEPFGERGMYYRNALLCMTIAGSHGVKTKLEDFMPDTFKGEPEVQTPEQMRAMMDILMNQQNQWVKEQEERKKNGGDSGS